MCGRCPHRCSPEGGFGASTRPGAVHSACLFHATPWERSINGFRARGHVELGLLNALDPARRGVAANRRLDELRRTFGIDAVPPPRGAIAVVVPPPIPVERARHMTDAQGLRAMRRHGIRPTSFGPDGRMIGDAHTQDPAAHRRIAGHSGTRRPRRCATWRATTWAAAWPSPRWPPTTRPRPSEGPVRSRVVGGVPRHRSEIGDLGSAASADAMYVLRLARRQHSQHSDPAVRPRCLDLIDELVVLQAGSIDQELDSLER